MIKFDAYKVGDKEVACVDPRSIPKEDFELIYHWSLGEIHAACIKDDSGRIHIVIKSKERDRMVQNMVENNPFKIVEATSNMLSALEAKKQAKLTNIINLPIVRRNDT